MKKLTEDLIAIITSIMDQVKFSKSLPDKKDSPKDQDPATLVPDNKRDPPLEDGGSLLHLPQCCVGKKPHFILDYLISTAYRVFSPRAFPRP